MTALLVRTLASGPGNGGRGLILTGIAITGLLTAVNTWLLYRTDTATATPGPIWAAGTLNPAIIHQAAIARNGVITWLQQLSDTPRATYDEIIVNCPT